MRGWLCFAAAVAFCFAPLSAHAQTPAPVEAYGALPLVADAAISPDGRYVAIGGAQASGVQRVLIIDLDSTASAQAYAVHENSRLRGVGWADDGRVSFLISQTYAPGAILPPGYFYRGSPRRVTFWRNGVIDVAARDSQLLTIDEERPWNDNAADFIAPIEGDPGFGRMIGYDYNNNFRLAVFRVNFANNSVRAVSSGSTPQTIGFVLGRDGAVAARFDSNPETNVWSMYVYDGGTRPRLLLSDTSQLGEPLEVRGLLPNGHFAAIDDDTGYRVLYTIDRASGDRSVLYQREGFDVDSAIADPWTREIVGAAWTDVEREQAYFEPGLQSAYEAARAAMPGAAVQLTSWSRDRRRVVFYAERGLDGGGYYMLEPASGRLETLALSYPAIANLPQGERQSITYRARDNVRIPAYLTFPPGVERTRLPLVLLVHGGPHSRDTMDFDWWAAFLASRGYAVLQPNFRGSTGYGSAWEVAGRHEWGGLMQRDVEDGVDALARSGIIDPERVCIVGASYGGYAALVGAALTPDRYKCAASVAGVSDLDLMIRRSVAQAGGSDSMTADYFRLSIGDRDENRQRIRDLSPVNSAAAVQIPVLLIHGTDDVVVPIDQSTRMRDALQRAGKDVRMVTLRGDDHNLSDAETRIQMLREMEGFLAQHLAQ